MVHAMNVEVYFTPEIVADFGIKKTTTDKQQCIGIVLDRSGSMAGASIRSVKNAAINLVNQLYDEYDFFIIAYAGYKIVNYVKTGDYDVYNMIGNDKDDIIRAINTIKAGGRTSFKIAFDATTTVIKTLKNKPETSIIFFTDGYDTDTNDYESIKLSLGDLINALKMHTTHPKIHCLVFADYDAKFLGKVSNKTAMNLLSCRNRAY